MSAVPRWEQDDELLADLAQALREDAPAPRHVVDAAKAVFVWQTVDAELAALTHDSLLGEELLGEELLGDELLAGVRDGSSRIRSITFETEGLSVELEVDALGAVGQILPPQPGSITVRASLGEVSTVPADEVGRFVVRPFPRGPVSLHCLTASGRSFVTSWVSY